MQSDFKKISTGKECPQPFLSLLGTWQCPRIHFPAVGKHCQLRVNEPTSHCFLHSLGRVQHELCMLMRFIHELRIVRSQWDILLKLPIVPTQSRFHRYNAGGSEHIINHPTQKEDYTPNKTSMAVDTPPLFFLETGKDFAFHITCTFSSAVRLFSEHAAGELSKDQSQVHLL